MMGNSNWRHGKRHCLLTGLSPTCLRQIYPVNPRKERHGNGREVAQFQVCSGEPLLTFIGTFTQPALCDDYCQVLEVLFSVHFQYKRSNYGYIRSCFSLFVFYYYNSDFQYLSFNEIKLCLLRKMRLFGAYN